ncbi:hypothetical protein A8950_1794 [Dongia mobilis]|uniref:LPS-assembly lipoprotein n=1 Tax=Dongia mobilis TaxID=578943 RepID=A0A4R6WSE1_9PROT|nr:hypothetical protein [Dongia mobilis]TDQ81974.1 hypothetical protein A8950_1794 [Dongia mobilis]
MSWSRRALLQSLGSGIALGGAGAALSACGFRPLYGQTSTTAQSGATVDSHLAAIKIKAPVWERSASPYDAAGKAKYDARTAQVLHNALRNALNPYGQPTNPAYELSMELSEQVDPTLASDDGEIDRYDLRLKSHFRLGRVDGTELMLEDVFVYSSFNKVREPYLDLVAQNDARERAAKQLAEMLKFRLSTYFVANG